MRGRFGIAGCVRRSQWIPSTAWSCRTAGILSSPYTCEHTNTILTSCDRAPMVRSVAHECFADEIAIDFPSAGRVVERMRDCVSRRVDVARSVRSRAGAVAARGVRRPGHARSSSRFAARARAAADAASRGPSRACAARDRAKRFSITPSTSRCRSGRQRRRHVPLPRHLAAYRFGARERPHRHSAVTRVIARQVEG